MDPSGEDRALRAAAFLVQALELGNDADPAAMAPDLLPLHQTPVTTTFVVELESSVGPTAFLIYVYSLSASADDGRSGRALFERDLTTLETAASLDTPGPRPLAHAQTEVEGFILATTPATLRVLQGTSDETTTGMIEAGLSD